MGFPAGHQHVPGGSLFADGIFTIVENGVPTTRALIRLNANGARDASFVFASPVVDAIGVQNNRVIVGTRESSSRVIVRLNADGTTDASFTRRVLSNTGRIIRVQSDNKILVLDEGNNFFRLNENGGDDGGFQATTFPAQLVDLQVNIDGRITLAHGNNTSTGLRFVRLLTNGTNDPSFTQFLYFYVPGCFTVQPDGGIVISENYIGGSATLVNGFMRVLPSGVQDTAYNAGGIGFQSIRPGKVRAIAVQSNGKILIGGDFDKVNNDNRQSLARLNADGTPDASFQITVSGANGTFGRIRDVYQIIALPDGKTLVGGNFSYVLNGTTFQSIVRLNQNGTIDPTFALGAFVGDLFEVNGAGQNKAALFADGKIVVGPSRGGAQNGKFPLKLNANGTADNAFNPTVYSTENLLYIYDIAVQPDGKILFGGRITTKSFVARLNADGSLDTTFQTNEETGKKVSTFALLPNGKIIVAKDDPQNSVSNISRLNANGSADNSFAAGTGANGKINSLLILPNGKILAGGKFTTFNGQPRRNLVLLNADGVLETTNYNVNEEVLTLAADGDGRVLIGGDFTSININGGQNFSRSYLARLTSSTNKTRFDFDGDGRADLAVFNPANGGWSIFSSQTNHIVPTQFGASGDRIAPADFDGDGRADYAVYRPSQGIWYVLQSTNGFAAYTWGASEDKPYPADFDGDGKADIAVWRPSNGIWYILRSSGHHAFYQFGQTGDIPVPADFDGDGKIDVAVWRPSNGTFYWLASASGNHLKGVQFGTLGDVPAVADYNGDNKADLVVFRPSQGIWHQYLTNANGSFTFSSVQFGQAGDEPVAADYDGDGKTDIAVRRQGVWHLLRSSQGFTGSAFGGANTQAIPALPN